MTSEIIFCVWMIGIIGAGYFLKQHTSENSYLVTAVKSVSTYIVLICLVSLLLLVADCYDPLLSASLTTGLTLSAIAFYGGRARGTAGPSYSADKKAILCITIFVILMIPPVAGRYETLEMNADVGVYTNRALQILSERTLMSDIEVRRELDDAQREVFDRTNMYYFTRSTGIGAFLMGTHLVIGKDSLFYFHAYPGWPMLMALWGSMFGYENMLYVMVLLYVLIIFLFFLILSRYVKDTLYSVVITIMFGSTPLLVYFSKYATSELFLLFLALYAFFLMSRNSFLDSAIAGLSVTLFSFTHVSGFAYTPLLLLLNILLFNWKDREKSFNASAFIAVAIFGSILSVPYGFVVSRRYFMDIYTSIFPDPWIGVSMILLFEFLCLALSLISLWYFRNSCSHALLNDTENKKCSVN